MYELGDYLAMVEDPVRTPAYLAAMRATIRPGDRVLELGTGFGFFAVAACRMGAAHVYAVEPNDAIALGPALAKANGCADRITFLQDVSQRVTLPDRADVLIEDLRGVSPLHLGRLGALADARARLLTPGARAIPMRDQLWCAATEWPVGDRPHQYDAPAMVEGLDVSAVRSVAGQMFQRTRRGANALLTDGAVWAEIDFANAPGRDAAGAPGSDVAGAVELVVRRDGRLDGIASWFSTELAPGITYDTAPGSPDTVHGRAVLPLATPTTVKRGDRLRVRLRATFDGADYVWAWEVVVEPASGGASSRQQGSTLAAHLMSAARRARRAASHRPTLTPELLRLRTLYAAVDGAATLAEIAARLLQRHSDRFANEREALRWASERLAADEEGAAP